MYSYCGPRNWYFIFYDLTRFRMLRDGYGTDYLLWIIPFHSMLFCVSKNLAGSVSNQMFCFISSNCINLEVNINFMVTASTVSKSRQALIYSSDHTNTLCNKYTCTHILFTIFKLRTQFQDKFLPVMKMKLLSTLNLSWMQ